MDDAHWHDVRALARQYADEVRRQAPPSVDEVPRTRSTEAVVLTILMVVAVLVGGVETAVLLRAGTEAGLPQPDPVVLAIESEPCMSRMTAIARAVDAHIEAHGAPPQTLNDLAAGALSEPLVEPYSNKSYLYKPDGQAYSLECPEPHRHPASS